MVLSFSFTFYNYQAPLLLIVRIRRWLKITCVWVCVCVCVQKHTQTQTFSNLRHRRLHHHSYFRPWHDRFTPRLVSAVRMPKRRCCFWSLCFCFHHYCYTKYCMWVPDNHVYILLLSQWGVDVHVQDISDSGQRRLTTQSYEKNFVVSRGWCVYVIEPTPSA
jgi:hypothetical protein